MTEVAQRSPQQELSALVRSDQFKQQVQLALPEGVSVDRFVRSFLTAMITSPKLATDASRESVMQSLLKAAQDGLLPDGREAALVIYSGKAQYLPMVGGYRKVAGEHGWALRTQCVYANDEFSYELGLDPVLKHVPTRPGREKGEIIAAYCVAAHADGRREVEVMDRSEIEKARKVSRAKDDGPWVTWYERMCEKTVAKRCFKKLPLGSDPLVQRLVAEDMAPGEAAVLVYGGEAPELPQAALADANAAGDETGDVEGVVDGDAIEVGDSSPVEEPETGVEGQESFSLPEGVADEAQLVRQIAEAAGSEEIAAGKHKGKSIEAVTNEPRGEGWLLWLLQQPNHPNHKSAMTYAAVFYPELVEAAREAKGA